MGDSLLLLKAQYKALFWVFVYHALENIFLKTTHVSSIPFA